ncbi:uncharacterized protein LOC130717753 isoform X2 [Lotus japonicus]|uniref:uncharacterized protein LOC130717753 isoform X2 n=1 Tax=Lotus japonicus TaxID=34305 RepID=UPI0025845663|nr:uncharacterized protein LOC130717753 isoform X2 [Lotus japonicus]
MDSNSQSPPHNNLDSKNVFRKPSGDAGSRNYRRRSPIEGSASPDGSPRHEHSSSPNTLRENCSKVSHHSRKYDGREQDRTYGRNHYGRSSDSRHSGRQSSWSSYGHSRHDKYADEDRFRVRLSSRSGRESRGDHIREESDSKPKDYQRSEDKNSRDKYDRSDYRSKEKDKEKYLKSQKYKDIDSSYERSGSGRRHAAYDEVERQTRDLDGRDEKRDFRRSSGEHRSDQAVSYSEIRSQKEDSSSQRDSSSKYHQDDYKNDQKELNSQNISWEEKRKFDDTDIIKNKDRNSRKIGEKFGIVDKESSGKKSKLFSADKGVNFGKDDERQTSSSKLPQESKEDLRATKTSGNNVGSDFDAAKVAAMRAAELVNKNLVGAGCLTTDQKKKLLWGAKKSTPTEESGHRWDTAMFTDRERQEKFNKLMGVKGEAKVEQNSDNNNSNDLLRAEKQKELQQDLEKQYTAGLRRRDGRTVGLGL